MKRAKITKVELVQGAMHSLSLEWNPDEARHLSDFNLSQIGGTILNSSTLGAGRGLVNVTRTELLAGDSITDDDSGPIFGDETEPVVETTLPKRQTPDYRDVWCEKHGLK